jgi:hypothetical protein
VSNPFICLEDEIMLRRSVRAVFKHEGWMGFYKVFGELARSLEIVGEVATDIMDEENKNKGGKGNERI